jgi:hypothetical protein
MTTLSSFKSLIGKLKREEIKSLLKYLRYYQDSKDESKGKGIQLVESVISDPTCSFKDLQIVLYGKENYHAFNKLLNRTKDKIYEVLLFDQNLTKHYYSERNRAVFDIRKKLLQSEILLLREINDDLDAFQNKIISKAKEYEIYDSLIEALHSKQRFMVLNGGKKIVEKIEKEIQYFEKSRLKVQRTRNTWIRIGAIISQSTSPKDYLNILIEQIKIVKQDYEETNSATIGYYYFFMDVEWHQINHLYKEAETILYRLLKLLISNVSIYTKERHSNILVNLANNEIHLQDFTTAIVNINLAQKYFDSKSANLNVAKEVEFFARFYKNELKESEAIISEIYNSSRSNNTPFLYSKHAYLYASLLTLKGDFNKSNELLLDVKEIEKDKEGWNVGKRILSIINRIELNDFENVDLKVLSFEKFIKRILKFRHVRKRDVIIVRILLKLINESFDFEKVFHQRKKYFELLESSDPEYGWKIKSPELIVFHEWFKRKMLENSKLKIQNSV